MDHSKVHISECWSKHVATKTCSNHAYKTYFSLHRWSDRSSGDFVKTFIQLTLWLEKLYIKWPYINKIHRRFEPHPCRKLVGSRTKTKRQIHLYTQHGMAQWKRLSRAHSPVALESGGKSDEVFACRGHCGLTCVHIFKCSLFVSCRKICQNGVLS